MTMNRIARPLCWLLLGLTAAAFAAAAVMKLGGQAQMITEFDRIGLGQWFRIVTGLVELTGAGLLLWPSRSTLGATILLCVCTGALVAQLGPLHGDVIHVFVLLGLIVAGQWLRRAGV